ncbi:MAG TPA: hypothetical protein VKB47_04295 [Terracidiphilus sp.]|nr:hypothetical protein [Terracidiphilus sp.]
MADKDVFENSTLAMRAPAVPRRVSWGAIFAGATAVIAVELLLNLLGAGVGAATINPQQGQLPGQGLALGAVIWFALSCIISLFIGGWIVGRLAERSSKRDGALHGFVTWAVASLVLVYMLSTAVGGLLGGAASVLGQTASLAGRGAQAAAPMMTDVIGQATGVTPEEVRADAGDLARDPNFQAFVSGLIRNGQVTPQDRQALAKLLIDRRHMNTEEANATIDRWQTQVEQGVQQAKQTTAQAATAAASGVSKGAFGSFFALLLGLVAAVAGSWVGTHEFVRSRPTAGHRTAA